jgi:FkbM family methyltransferase
MNRSIKKLVVRFLWRVMGRRNLARFARFLTNEVRLDVSNDMESNGERLVQKTALQIASSADSPITIFDAGANIGDWTCSLLEMAASDSVSNFRIHAFEPCEATYKTLRRRVGEYANASLVVPVQQALSSEPGSAVLNIIGDGAGTNSLYQHIDLAISRHETIRLTTVDVYCSENSIDHLVLLKIDTEGHDQSVMEGAQKMLERGAIDLIQFEYTHRWITSRHFLRDTFNLLQPHGYRIGKITPKGIEFYRDWHFELESFREANYLACKEEFIVHFPVLPWWND